MITSLTNTEAWLLEEAYNSVIPTRCAEIITEREDDDIEAISKYSDVRRINLYIKPVDGSIEQLYKADVQPVNINVTNGVVTIIGRDAEQKIDLQVVIQANGNTSIVPTSDSGEQVDGPWFEKDPMFWDTGSNEELNLMIIQEV
jgi:hypothetical protein